MFALLLSAIVLFCPAYIADAAAKPTVVTATLSKDRKSITFNQQPPLNRLFSIQLNLTTEANLEKKHSKLTRFDAQMPAHQHGMVTKPRITETPSGEYLIEGVKFHMPGLWNIIFEIAHGKDSSTIVMSLKL